jgi:hypothetical protein
MAVAEVSEATALLCPVCYGTLEPMQTLCARCRAEIEAEALSAKAEDFPLLAQNQAQPEQPAHEAMVPDQKDSATNLEDAPQLAMGDDPDLLPLAPVDEPRRPARPATAAPSVTVRPAGAPPAPPISNRAKLAPKSKWKYIVIAICAIILTAVLAALLWSSIMPPADATDAGSPPAKQTSPRK